MKKRFRYLLEDTHIDQRHTRVLFRASNLEDYFYKGLDVFYWSKDSTFDMIQLAIPQCRNILDLTHHVNHILGIATHVNVLRNSIASLVVSTLLIDAFPPARHSKQIRPVSKPY